MISGVNDPSAAANDNLTTPHFHCRKCPEDVDSRPKKRNINTVCRLVIDIYLFCFNSVGELTAVVLAITLLHGI